MSQKNFQEEIEIAPKSGLWYFFWKQHEVVVVDKTFVCKWEREKYPGGCVRQTNRNRNSHQQTKLYD